MTGFGQGGIKLTPKNVSKKTWGNFTASAEYTVNGNNSFTKNVGGTWNGRITSNQQYFGPVKLEGTLLGDDSCFSLDKNRYVAFPYNGDYCWYLQPGSLIYCRMNGVNYSGPFAHLPNSIYGIRKYYNGVSWTIEWYVKTNGVKIIIITFNTMVNEILGFLGGAFLLGNILTVSNNR